MSDGFDVKVIRSLSSTLRYNENFVFDHSAKIVWYVPILPASHVAATSTLLDFKHTFPSRICLTISDPLLTFATKHGAYWTEEVLAPAHLSSQISNRSDDCRKFYNEDTIDYIALGCLVF